MDVVLLRGDRRILPTAAFRILENKNGIKCRVQVIGANIRYADSLRQQVINALINALKRTKTQTKIQKNGGDKMRFIIKAKFLHNLLLTQIINLCALISIRICFSFIEKTFQELRRVVSFHYFHARAQCQWSWYYCRDNITTR